MYNSGTDTGHLKKKVKAQKYLFQSLSGFTHSRAINKC